MKRFFVLLALLSITQFSFGQTEKTFIKSFNLQGSSFVVLKLDGEVEVKEWNDTFLRVHTNVGLENGSSSVLKQFLTLGRYNLKNKTADGNFIIESAARVPNVKYKGQVLIEKVTYTVFVPTNVEVEVINDGAATSLIIKNNL